MIERVKFANLPTPVSSLPRLSEALGGPEIWVKRDDLTGLAFGGNKTRKLEFVLADVLKNNAQTLISVGAAQSNHCRQTAAMAAKFGLDCILVLSGDPKEELSGNLLIDEILGAKIVWTDKESRDATLQVTYETAEKEGRKPYLIPLGASNPIGSVAYAFAFEEIMQQMSKVDWVVFPSSSGGTQAGLVLGAAREQWTGHILGISVDRGEVELQNIVSNLATLASKNIGESISFTPDEILVNADYLGGGYGVVGDPEIEATRLFARLEGIILGPVYTARAAAGMIDLIRKGFFKPTDRVLFWHTGGTPTIFAPKYAQLMKF